MVTGAISDTKYSIIQNEGIVGDVTSHNLFLLLSGMTEDDAHGMWHDSPIRLGYDIHAGFYFPDNSELAAAMYSSGQSFVVEPILIDEREQSGKNPFSPTQAYVEINGVSQRRRVSNSGSAYVSNLPVDIDRIKEAYRFLDEKLYEESIRHFVEEAEKNSPETLGEFLRLMHSDLLRNQIGCLPNVSVSDMKFDKFDIQNGHTEHNEEVHKNQQILYIGVHKLAAGDARSFSRVADKFRKARQEGRLSENPIYIITPQNPVSYFRRD